MSTNQESNNDSISLGGAIVAFALFGLAKQMGWETELVWTDAFICAAGIFGVLGGLLNQKMIQVVVSLIAVVGLLGYRHDLFHIDLGILLFAVILIVGGGMVVNGIAGKSGS